MASDSSESPLVLTPESTGTSVATGLSTPDTSFTAKKARRQTAFYPNMNSANKPQKPFSRSAAKRESVMALGSIEHLQHYFTKTGIAAKKNPLNKPHHGLVPAIGGMGHVPTTPSITSLSDILMPPSPVNPSPARPILSPHVKTHEVDPESLLPGVIDDLISVAQAWKLDRNAVQSGQPTLNLPFDVLEVLKTTTRAIRSTRNYLLSLPDDSSGTIRAHVQPRILGPGRHTNPSTSTSAESASKVSQPIALIRRSALEVLTVLRQLEENCRVPLSDDAYDAQSDGGHSRGGGTTSSPSNGTLELPLDERRLSDAGQDPDASISFSLVQVQGRYESVPVWEEEEDTFSLEHEEEKKDGWDERLVLGSGWLYKQDVTLAELEKEREVVASYLDTVDDALFDGKTGGSDERGWERTRRQREGRAASRSSKTRRVSAGDGEGRSMSLGLPADGGRRRVSTGMVNIMQGMTLSEEPEGEDMNEIKEEGEDEVEDEVEDDELPEWAKRSNFPNDNLGRLHALLAFFLPSNLLPALGPPNSRSGLLISLSSGQLLCVAYNVCVRKSKQPWGFVSKDGIHDILALEAAAKKNGDEDGSKKVWTFRRTDNLRLWAGALKLRYMLPIQTPSQPLAMPLTTSTSGTPLSSPSAAAQKFQFGKADREPPILFDAKVVAKKDDGWEDMLERVLYRWMEKVLEERRVHH